MRGPLIQASNGVAQSAPLQEAEPKLPQPTVTGCTIAACKSVIVSAVPPAAAPAANATVVAAPAVTGAVPATTANLAEPSGQRFLIDACAVAPETAISLPLGMSPWRSAKPTQNGAVSVVADKRLNWRAPLL